MSLQLNQFNLAGNIARDLEYKQTTDYVLVKFAVGFNYRYKKGEASVSEPTFVDCEAWGKTADFIAKYFGKGDGIFLTGRIKQEKWIKDGVTHSRLVMVVDEAAFTESKSSKPATAAGGAA